GPGPIDRAPIAADSFHGSPDPESGPAARSREHDFGEYQMRFSIITLLAGCMALASTGNADPASWTSAKIPGEQDRAAQGCAADSQKPGDWLCIIVRCDQAGAPLSLHFSAPGPDIRGDIKLVIDEDTFSVSVPASAKSALPLSTRAEAMPDALLEA